MKKKNILVSMVSTVALLGSLHSSADSYMGVSAGASDIDTEITNLTGTATLDESDSGFKIFYGFNVKPQVAIELHYADFGEAALSGNNGDNFDLGGSTFVFTANNADVVVDGSSFGASAVFKFVEEGTFVPFAKLGIHRWSADVTASTSTSANTVSDDGFDINYGLGAGINITDAFAIRAEYEVYDFDGVDYTLASVGASFNF